MIDNPLGNRPAYFKHGGLRIPTTRERVFRKRLVRRGNALIYWRDSGARPTCFPHVLRNWPPSKRQPHINVITSCLPNQPQGKTVGNWRSTMRFGTVKGVHKQQVEAGMRARWAWTLWPWVGAGSCMWLCVYVCACEDSKFYLLRCSYRICSTPLSAITAFERIGVLTGATSLPDEHTAMSAPSASTHQLYQKADSLQIPFCPFTCCREAIISEGAA